MAKDQLPLSKKEFDDIYSKVPRLTVEIIIKDQKNRLFLTKRAIEPCKGQWHIPGGTVLFGETLIEAVKRIAMREVGIKVLNTSNQGIIEYPSHYKKGLDSPVGIVFEITDYLGLPKINDEASQSGWFSKIPTPFHKDQNSFLLDNGYLTT